MRAYVETLRNLYLKNKITVSELRLRISESGERGTITQEEFNYITQ